MTGGEFYDFWRIANVMLAITALVLNLFKMPHIWKAMPIDAKIGFLSALFWPGAYAIATPIAAFHDVQAGIWTGIMGIPIMWSVIAGLVGDWGLIGRVQRHG